MNANKLIILYRDCKDETTKEGSYKVGKVKSQRLRLQWETIVAISLSTLTLYFRTFFSSSRRLRIWEKGGSKRYKGKKGTGIYNGNVDVLIFTSSYVILEKEWTPFNVAISVQIPTSYTGIKYITGNIKNDGKHRRGPTL